ncbi:hypothetical protein TWF730_001222 [Orbilia blumenaviensis]|uniref:DNA polymerase delta subunit 4 n=1 Tax=Orbilia blumenaviensis TaxID=1796055 RepID=A0AAV9VP12_9PEZI
MPVSTRHSAVPASQQSKLNFVSKKNVSYQKAVTHDTAFRAPASPPKHEIKAVLENAAKSEEKETNGPKFETVAATAEQSNELEEEPVEEQVLFQEELVDKPVLARGIDKQFVDKAYKITDPHIHKYWKDIENSRIHQAVHQQGLAEYEKILRHFDLSSQYGPCVGVTRLKRWERAQRLGLEPPIEVLAVLLKSELGEVEESPPQGWKPAPASAREDVGPEAYVNELLATRTE